MVKRWRMLWFAWKELGNEDRNAAGFWDADERGLIPGSLRVQQSLPEACSRPRMYP